MLDILTNVVPYVLPRILSATLIAISISASLLVISIHIKNKFAPILFFLMDISMLLFLFKAFSSTGILLLKSCF